MKKSRRNWRLCSVERIMLGGLGKDVVEGSIWVGSRNL